MSLEPTTHSRDQKIPVQGIRPVTGGPPIKEPLPVSEPIETTRPPASERRTLLSTDIDILHGSGVGL